MMRQCGCDPLLLCLAVVIFLRRTVADCSWNTGSGRLQPLIGGTIHSVQVLDLLACEDACMRESTDLCAAINYDSGECELLTENSRTAAVVNENEWTYRDRPLCAGIWLPWLTWKGYYITECSKFLTSYQPSLGDCMRFCLEESSEATDCEALNIARNGNGAERCQLCSWKYNNSVQLGVNKEWQYFGLPLWYRNDSANTVGQNPMNVGGGAGPSLQLLTSQKIPIDGYLVGWKYFVGRIAACPSPEEDGSCACPSYAGVWRPTGQGRYMLIGKTLLTGSANTTGLRFQFLQHPDDVIKVQTDDVISVHVNKRGGCKGNLVSFTQLGSASAAIVNKFNGDLPIETELGTSDGGIQTIYVSLRGIITGFMRLDTPPRAVHENLPTDSVKLTWDSWRGDGQPFGYKILCSAEPQITETDICLSATVPFGTNSAHVSSKDFRTPLYAAVQMVRNVNGSQWKESIGPVSSPICPVRSRLPPEQALIIADEPLSPGVHTTVFISVPFEMPDLCAKYIKLKFTEDGRDSQTDPAGVNGPVVNVSVSLLQGRQYSLTVWLTLYDDYTMDLWSGTYMTRVASSLSAPFAFNISGVRGSDRISLTWSPVAGAFTYQVSCSTAMKSPSFNQNLAGTTVNITGLNTQTNYACTVRGATNGGVVGAAASVTFWTRPLETEPQWKATAVANVTSTGTVIIPLPVNDLTTPEARFEYIQVLVKPHNTATRRRRSVTRLDGSNLAGGTYITAQLPSNGTRDTFTVGDNRTYGGYQNIPLSDGVYSIYVGLLAGTEIAVDWFYPVPGGDAVKVGYKATLIQTSPTSVAESALGAIIGGSLGGLVALILITLVAVILLRRRYSKMQALQSPPIGTSTVDEEIRFTYPTSHIPECSANKNENSSTQVYENLVVETTLPLSTAIPVSQLHQRIKDELMRNREEPFEEEYQKLPSVDLPFEMSRLSGNLRKNRFKNILPFDTNRVILDVEDDDPLSDYINASYIKSFNGEVKYVASQAPNLHTVADMWRMIIHTQSEVIIMLTNIVENGKNKCTEYWPVDQATPCLYGKVTVVLKEVEEYAEFFIRTLEYSTAKVSGTVTQFHFTEWPDHGVPTAAGLLSFRHRAKQAMLSTRNPVVVHCSAGAGRSGTFIGLDILVDEVQRSVRKSEPTVDVFNCVKFMRSQRMHMVQTADQYAFLYMTLSEALTCGNSSVSCTHFQNKHKIWRKVNPKTGTNTLTDQFQRMNITLTEASPAQYSNALLSVNVNKNREVDVLPLDSHRFYLTSKCPGSNDFINAVYCNAYQKRNGFIATQHPTTNTLQDFWAMIAEVQSPVIISFNDYQAEDPYWPLIGGPRTCGMFNIACLEETAKETVIHRKLEITTGKTTITTAHLEVAVEEGQLPSRSTLLALCKIVESLPSISNEVNIVQCRDGARLSGLFLVAMNIFRRVRVEQDVDIVLEIKLARRSRPQFISSQAMFELIYDFVELYLSEFDTYSNFGPIDTHL